VEKVFIIAEAGDNHNGDFNLALKLVDIAKESGADAVKFQTFKTECVISKFAEKAEYQKKCTGRQESQLEMAKKLELKFEDFEKLNKYCKEKEIIFLSTPFDLESIEFLKKLNMPFWKIPSGEITNLPYIIKIAQNDKPMVISTGMCKIEEIQETFSIIKKCNQKEIVLLHCNTEYPTPFEDVNLRAMLTLKEKFNCKVGYSDHTLGITVPIAAAAIGACIIEKHFTLNRNMEGPDHQASLEPYELKNMVKSIREVEKILGNFNKNPSNSERKNINIARKSIIAKRNIKINEIFTEENITTKRPGNGISPMKWFEILGRTAKRDFLKDELIEI